MSDKSRWFTVLYGTSALAVFTGLATILLLEWFGIPVYLPVGVFLGNLVVIGGFAFVTLQWVGVGLGYVSALGAIFYTALWVVVGLASLIVNHT